MGNKVEVRTEYLRSNGIRYTAFETHLVHFFPSSPLEETECNQRSTFFAVWGVRPWVIHLMVFLPGSGRTTHLSIHNDQFGFIQALDQSLLIG